MTYEMATLTVEIDRTNDLSAVKDFIERLGLSYQVKETDIMQYSEGLQSIMDKPYTSFEAGPESKISKEESKRRIQEMLITKYI